MATHIDSSSSVESSVPAFIVKHILEALISDGIAIEPVLEQTGISLRVMTDIEQRVSYSALARLWELAEQATGDPGFAVHFAERLKPDSSYPCHYLMAAASNVGEGLFRLVRYARLCTGGEELSLSVEAARARLTRRVVIPSPHADEFLLTFLLLRSRLATGVDWTPEQLVLPHHRAAGCAELARVFRCPIVARGSTVELCFSSAVLELPHVEAHPDSSLLGLLTSFADELRKGLPTSTGCVGKVASTIATQLSKELPTLASTAHLLRMTERTLQRRLSDEGTRYSQVFDGVRRGLAMRFLGEPSLSVAQVGFILHFADESAFQRAFKRWTGQTPGQYRRVSRSSTPPPADLRHLTGVT